MSQNPSEIKVNYIYKKKDDLKRHFVNGIYGGRTTQGEILCTFYFEHAVLPDEEVIIVKEGEIVQKDLDSSNLRIERDFEVSIIMSPLQAKNIGEWLVKLTEGNSKSEEPKK